MTVIHRILKMHPANLVLVTFLVAIAVGTVLLKLPLATTTGAVSWVDALFMATSAICVTGLTVMDPGSRFSLFGQCVLLFLIQIGGLGVMTISVALFQWIGRGISIRQRLAMQELFAAAPRKDIFNLVKSIILFTFGAELVGAICLTICWIREFGFFKSFYYAVFHSVAAFCNAGFSLFPDSLIRYSDHIVINLAIAVLIIIGGIGFPVLYDLQCWFKSKKRSRFRLSIQTKTVLWTSLLLIAGGSLMYAFLERKTLGASPSWSHRILVPFFQSITCRTAGFNTVDISSLREATLAVMIFLMFFGASPGSCGGGVKTTTLALLIAFTISRVRHGRRVNLFRKSLPGDTIARAISLILVSIAIVCLVLFMLLMGDPVTGYEPAGVTHSFIGFFFETISAFGTVGLSMGVTPELNTWGKSWIILIMIIGRVGVLTFSYIIVGAGKPEGVEYAEENMMVG